MLRLLGFAIAALLLLVAAGLGGIATWIYAASKQGTVGALSFRTPLRIPPLLEPVEDAPGRKRFTLTLQPGVSELVPGRRVETWGANGPYLGPTLRAARGDRVAIEVANHLPEATTLHWHGMRLPAVMDGGPHQLVEPGATWSPEWTIDQPAASLWYHPHPHGRTAEHVYRGVAGLFIIDDAVSAGLELPRDYGVDDVPLILQDKRSAQDGSLSASPESPTGLPGLDMYGLRGDHVLVNGTFDPYFTVTTTRVRLRLLNASNARSYNVGFADGRSFHLIATDSGLLPAPEPLTRVRLSPGERAEIVAEFQPGEQVVLQSFAPGLAGGFPQERVAGYDDQFDLLKLVAAPELAPSPSLSPRLSDESPITPPDGATVRTFRLSGTSEINGAQMDLHRVDATVPAGAREVWQIENPGIPHNFHIHEVALRILDVNGQPPPVEARGRKDTAYLPPESTVRLAIDFGPYADPDHPYMFHCHMLLHEDRGMMGQFVLVGPGGAPGVVAASVLAWPSARPGVGSAAWH
jgi:suppressor of ftsI